MVMTELMLRGGGGDNDCIPDQPINCKEVAPGHLPKGGKKEARIFAVSEQKKTRGSSFVRGLPKRGSREERGEDQSVQRGKRPQPEVDGVRKDKKEMKGINTWRVAGERSTTHHKNQGRSRGRPRFPLEEGSVDPSTKRGTWARYFVLGKILCVVGTRKVTLKGSPKGGGRRPSLDR